MRDIRPDLKERLEGLEAESEEHKFAIIRIDQQKIGIKALLAAEDARWKSVQPALFQNGHALPEDEGHQGQTPLAQFLQQALRDRRPQELKELVLRAIQEQINFEGKNPGRTLHFALVGLQQHGYVERDDRTGAWRWIGGEKQTAQRS
jgi:hypothetical protein